jgi:hypothetical protein
MRSIHTRKTSATMGSWTVQGADIIKEGSAPSTASSARCGYRSVHLRGKRRDSAVDDTLNGGMVYGMA